MRLLTYPTGYRALGQFWPGPGAVGVKNALAGQAVVQEGSIVVRRTGVCKRKLPPNPIVWPPCDVFDFCHPTNSAQPPLAVTVTGGADPVFAATYAGDYPEWGVGDGLTNHCFYIASFDNGSFRRELAFLFCPDEAHVGAFGDNQDGSDDEAVANFANPITCPSATLDFFHADDWYFELRDNLILNGWLIFTCTNGSSPHNAQLADGAIFTCSFNGRLPPWPS